MTTWNVWTDGSCHHGVPNVAKGVLGWGGWAAIVEHESDGQVLRGRVPQTTNVRMEILAAVEGLRAVPGGAHAVLRTDCTTLIVVRDWHDAGRLGSYTGRDSRLWRALAVELERLQVTMRLLVRAHRDPIHRRAHALAGAEARGGLRDLPLNATPLDDASRAVRRWIRDSAQLDDGHRVRGGMARRLVHQTGCSASDCVASCPVWKEHGALVYTSRRRSEGGRRFF